MTDASVRRTPWTFQFQVLKALILRDINARFGDKRLGYVWALINPVLVVVGLLIIFTVRSRMAPPALPLMVFIATGFPIFFAFMTMWNGTGANPGDGLLMFPQVTLLDLVVSRMALEFITQTAAFVIICVGLILIGGAELPADPIGVMVVFWGVMAVGAGLGLSNMAVARVFPVVNTILGPIKRLSVFISGVIFTASQLPSFALPWFSWNPVFHGIELARTLWYPAYRTPIGDPWYIALVALFLFAFGIAAERVTRRFIGR
jgi:capsular polysaccharide transport system permease protein